MCDSKVLHLKFVGMDSWDRPVYKDDTGTLWKDVAPRADMKPDLCTSVNNKFNGEPDTGMKYLEKYQDVTVAFEPQPDMARKRPMTTEELFDRINGILKGKGKLPDILDYRLATHNLVPITNYEYGLKNKLDYGGNEGRTTSEGCRLCADRSGTERRRGSCD